MPYRTFENPTRYDYVTWFANSEILKFRKIFIDESGCNTRTRRFRGRAVRNERVYQKVATWNQRRK